MTKDMADIECKKILYIDFDNFRIVGEGQPGDLDNLLDYRWQRFSVFDDHSNYGEPSGDWGF